MLRSVTILCAWLALLSTAVAQRNSKEEAICQPFLTSRKTSPLLVNLQRDLDVDEDGEFACELVLQDSQLPVQIRVTIHEGLGLLAVRHSQMGVPRQNVAAKHFRLLAELLPTSMDFSLKASTFLLDPFVSDARLAMKYLENVLYGKAAQDPKRTASHVYIARSLYIKALARTQRYHDAEFELELLMRDFPYDFEAAALLQHPGGMHFNYLLHEPQAAYSKIQELGTSEYAGFVPPCVPSTEVGVDAAGSVAVEALPWAPQTYTRLLSDAEFLGHVQRREPFLVRFGSAQNMSATLGWGTQAWLGEAGKVYLQRAVGDKEKVLVESRPHISASKLEDKDPALTAGSFGFGLDAHRKFMTFSDLLASDFTNAQGNESVYLNIQQPDLLHPEETHRTPLHLLKKDIPLPSMLHSVAENITEVNLWMGVARDRDAQSKLHMDATDNLYVVLEGAKKFTIASPADALKIGTVSPTIAVSPDGMSFQFDVSKFSGYLKWKAQKEQADLAAAAAASASRNSSSGEPAASTVATSTESRSVAESSLHTSSLLLTPSALQEHLVRKDIEYDASNFHFSLLDANAPAQQLKSAQCDPDTPHFTSFTLQAGDMLYLPTGWFHQVVSKQGRHMAVNYWWRALNWRGAVEFERARSEAVFEQLLA